MSFAKLLRFSGCPMLKPNLINFVPIGYQVRCMAARRGKRIAANRAKLAKSRQRKEEEKKLGPKVWVPPRLRVDKTVLNMGPRRFSDENLKELSSIVDDVYVISNYKEKSYSLMDIISMHRETHHPEIYNAPDALVDARIELDLRTKKKTKCLDPFSGILLYPNKFGFGGQRKIIAICKSESDKEASRIAGAEIIGANEIVRSIKTGQIIFSDFDDLVCHGDMLIEVYPIRGILGKKFPTKSRGNLGFDMGRLVNNFVNGVEFKCQRDEFEQDYGWVELSFGKLDMTIEQLQENLEHLFINVEKHAPPGAPGPSFVTRVLISSKPSPEKIKLKHWEYIEGYENPQEKAEADDEEDEEAPNEIELTNLSKGA